MAAFNEPTQLLFYEIAMAIGNDLDLRAMLKESVTTLLRKLNCSAGCVLRAQDRREDPAGWTAVYSVPRHLTSTNLFRTGLSDLRKVWQQAPAPYRNALLPRHQAVDESHLHWMALKDFGVLLVVKQDPDLDPFVLKALAPLNAKLARACLACLQKQQADAARREAERASQLKTEFLANMSHEIRTPMNGILNLTDLLAEGPLDETQQLYLQTIRDSSRHLLRVLNDILDLSKIEAGHLDIQRGPCDLSALLHDIETLWRPKAENKGLKLVVERAPGTPDGVVTDSGRLHQCLTNLVNNAIKFTDAGQVTVRVSRVETHGPSRLRFDVEDTGVGIAADQQLKVFESFRQVDGSTTRRHGGTGLGLAIVKNLAVRLGGDLWLASQPGAGSTFTLELPCDEVSEPCPAAFERRARDRAALAGRLLVVEDEPTNQLVIQQLLEGFGLDVRLVDNGQAAVEATREDRFDAVLMDIQMPVMNGLEATRRIVRTRPDLPVIALTARALPEDRQRCFEAGCRDYLAKPIDPERLHATLLALLSPVEAAETAH